MAVGGLSSCDSVAAAEGSEEKKDQSEANAVIGDRTQSIDDDLRR